jgi:hypothetical protein
MPNADSHLPRPTLLNPRLLASTVDQLGHHAGSRTDVWRLLTEHFAVDLDAVAALLPGAEPEPHWLPMRR